jgi:hypothetical protein
MARRCGGTGPRARPGCPGSASCRVGGEIRGFRRFHGSFSRTTHFCFWMTPSLTWLRKFRRSLPPGRYPFRTDSAQVAATKRLAVASPDCKGSTLRSRTYSDARILSPRCSMSAVEYAAFVIGVVLCTKGVRPYGFQVTRLHVQVKTISGNQDLRSCLFHVHAESRLRILNQMFLRRKSRHSAEIHAPRQSVLYLHAVYWQ